MDYAEAIVRLNDEIGTAIARGERAGLSDGEMIDELIRIAEELRAEGKVKAKGRAP